jgi:3-hydroxyisobutyrate dehydrogenase-like beta-hydroxyacid dehydrogenase
MAKADTSTVTVIGLGAMGGQLARAFLVKGADVTVWNRSPQRAATFAEMGARIAASAADAVKASDLTVMCVLSCQAADEILAAPGVIPALGGRTLVQLSAGHDQEIRRQYARVEQAGGRMLAGGIVAYPFLIGESTTTILYSGSEPAFEEHRETLALLAGAQRFLGSDPARFGATFHALFAYYHAAYAGYLEGLALATAQGVALEDFSALIPGMDVMLSHHIPDAALRIRDAEYGGEQASIDTHIGGISVMLQLARDHGVQMHVMDAFIEYCRAAHDAGEGGQDIAAIYKRMVAGEKGGGTHQAG